jgi:hypothetical protein
MATRTETFQMLAHKVLLARNLLTLSVDETKIFLFYTNRVEEADASGLHHDRRQCQFEKTSIA